MHWAPTTRSACAMRTGTMADRIGSLCDALEFIGGVPELLVPDKPSKRWTAPHRARVVDPPFRDLMRVSGAVRAWPTDGQRAVQYPGNRKRRQLTRPRNPART